MLEALLGSLSFEAGQRQRSSWEWPSDPGMASGVLLVGLVLQNSLDMLQSENLQKARGAARHGVSLSVALLQILQLRHVHTFCNTLQSFLGISPGKIHICQPLPCGSLGTL